MSDVPLVRDRLEQIVVEIENGYPYDDVAELRKMIELLKREKPVFKAKAEHAKLTPKLVAFIKRARRAHPDWPLDRIADVADVNVGRVSEVLRGKRK